MASHEASTPLLLEGDSRHQRSTSGSFRRSVGRRSCVSARWPSVSTCWPQLRAVPLWRVAVYRHALAELPRPSHPPQPRLIRLEQAIRQRWNRRYQRTSGDRVSDPARHRQHSAWPGPPTQLAGKLWVLGSTTVTVGHPTSCASVRIPSRASTRDLRSPRRVTSRRACDTGRHRQEDRLPRTAPGTRLSHAALNQRLARRSCGRDAWPARLADLARGAPLCRK
jgi:hypothetical protein